MEKLLCWRSPTRILCTNFNVYYYFKCSSAASRVHPRRPRPTMGESIKFRGCSKASKL